MRWFLQKAPPAIIPGSAAPAGSDGSTSHESDGIENSFESVNRRKAALHLKGGGQLGFFSMDLFPLFNWGIMTGGKWCFWVLFELTAPVCFLLFRLFHVVHGAVVVNLS